MKVLHIVPGVDDIANGMAVVAKLLAKEQGDAEVVDLKSGLHGNIVSDMTGRSGVSPLQGKGAFDFFKKRRDAPRIEPPSALASLGEYASPSQSDEPVEGKCEDVEEVWVHGMWLPKEWLACWRTLKSGKRLVRVPHGSVDPVRLRFHGWKKWLVGPIERWCFRRCDRIVATCEAEKGWIEAYLGKHCPPIEVTDIKRFFELVSGGVESEGVGCAGVAKNSQLITHNAQLHLLYLGRRHPLKGVEYLEKAVEELNSNPVNPVNPGQNSSTSATRSTRLTTSAPSASLGTRFARLGRFPMGRAHPQGAVTRLCVRLVSNAFGEELEKVWDWCDVLVLPTLSDNFGLVVAEALERGKRVITTDGAPAWGEGLELGVGSGGVEELRVESGGVKSVGVGSGIWFGYEGRLIYLKGYRDGTDEERVELLKKAIERICK